MIISLSLNQSEFNASVITNHKLMWHTLLSSAVRTHCAVISQRADVLLFYGWPSQLFLAEIRCRLTSSSFDEACVIWPFRRRYSWTSTSAVNDGSDRFRGRKCRHGVLSRRISLLRCNGRASVVLSQAESPLDVRNDEFGLCEVNNAKMDCYPERARYRAMWSAVRGQRPVRDWND